MSWFNCFMCKDVRNDNIKVLDFSRSSLTDVPTEVFNCERTLEILYLDGNKIADLPRTLFQCEELRYLDISDNEVQTIPGLISKLINLNSFNISRNFLSHSQVPLNMHRCQKLTILDLSSNSLEKVPEGLTSLINLQQLYLNDVCVDYLPANFGRLCNLKILELRDNNLSALPKSLRRLSSLQRLDLSNNDFAELPEVVGSMQNLTELWVNGNCINSIHSNVGNLRKLQHFDASKNDLEEVPIEIGQWVKLTILILSNNLIKGVPHTIGTLCNLETLKLDFNCIEKLPSTIGQLKTLEDLDIQGNRLQTLPTSIGLLRNLKCLVASENFLKSLPSEIGSCSSLSILSINNNFIDRLPDEIGHLQNLSSLSLIGNTIEYLPIPVANLPKLRALWLSENQCHPLIPLQKEKLINGQSVLTCYLLPQMRPRNNDLEYRNTSSVLTQKRHICFTEPGSTHRQAARLTRAPTPYPKDLQRYQRSLINSLRRNSTVTSQNVNCIDQKSLEIKEAKVMPMKSNAEESNVKPSNEQAEPLLTDDDHNDNPSDTDDSYENINRCSNIREYFSLQKKKAIKGENLAECIPLCELEAEDISTNKHNTLEYEMTDQKLCHIENTMTHIEKSELNSGSYEVNPLCFSLKDNDSSVFTRQYVTRDFLQKTPNNENEHKNFKAMTYGDIQNEDFHRQSTQITESKIKALSENYMPETTVQNNNDLLSTKTLNAPDNTDDMQKLFKDAHNNEQRNMFSRKYMARDTKPPSAVTGIANTEQTQYTEKPYLKCNNNPHESSEAVFKKEYTKGFTYIPNLTNKNHKKADFVEISSNLYMPEHISKQYQQHSSCTSVLCSCRPEINPNENHIGHSFCKQEWEGIQKVQNQDPLTVQKQPPPYHVAAIFSKQAKYFTNDKIVDDSDEGVEQPRNFIQDQPQNIIMPQPQHPQKTNHSLINLPTNYFDSQQKIQSKHMSSANSSVQLSFSENGDDTEYSNKELNSKKINKWMFGPHRNTKLLNIVLKTSVTGTLGFSIKCHVDGIFVTNVKKQGNANELEENDKIIMMDDIDLTEMNTEEAYRIVTKKGSKAKSFLVARL